MGSDEMVIRNTYFVQVLNEIFAIAATPIQHNSASMGDVLLENAAVWTRKTHGHLEVSRLSCNIGP
jgi:hypothetical protein